jgi:ligand-binding sensor domain-containing protein
VLRRALLCSSLLLAAATAGAQARAAKEEPSLAQLAHRTWTSRDGVPNSVWQIAQTRDGFLWLAGATGLARFDGVRFERYEPPPGQALPATSVNVLLQPPTARCGSATRSAE